ncbi:hypothetical protein GCM10010326_65990 [Streptomyces xanthochromogenes]|uniref:Uncharacterized protein n=1 Tax=Streptomyces xanthochromogenes TaxID=67384 RepID=A0ABQ3APR7_9ACTN|nr:hypothetical protein GCM10010326_65990 [Streptomyces xanthochromogenes]
MAKGVGSRQCQGIAHFSFAQPGQERDGDHTRAPAGRGERHRLPPVGQLIGHQLRSWFQLGHGAGGSVDVAVEFTKGERYRPAVPAGDERRAVRLAAVTARRSPSRVVPRQIPSVR